MAKITAEEVATSLRKWGHYLLKLSTREDLDKVHVRSCHKRPLVPCYEVDGSLDPVGFVQEGPVTLCIEVEDHVLSGKVIK